MTTKRILVPVDFSLFSDAAVTYAAVIARGLDASITLLHVVEPVTGMAGIVPGEDAAQDLAASRVLSLTNIDQLIEKSPTLDGLTLNRVVEVGYAESRIVEYATVENMDLIVMGTHGRSGFARWRLGNVAQGVMHLATCAVLSVHLPLSST